MPPKHSFKANGKVLLSGEYLVMDGALALGLPLNKGQQLTVTEGSGSDIVWKSHLPNGSIWFSSKFDLFGFEPIKASDKATAITLKEVFEAAVRLNSDFLSKWKKYTVNTYLDFQPDWGLGSSSTLIECLANWADVDPFDLQYHTFGGSGYDIACASAEGPVLYRTDETTIDVEPAPFFPSFVDQLYFAYLGRKQNTLAAIENYRKKKVSSSQIDAVSEITKALCEADQLVCFDELIREHEKIISELIGIDRIMETYFQDYWGEVKSLGAWGGDFVLVTSNRTPIETQSYFTDKGIDVFYRFHDLALNFSAVKQKV